MHVFMLEFDENEIIDAFSALLSMLVVLGVVD
jgi:uncharacterized membrane protein